MVLILLLGLALGGIAGMRRQAAEREALISEMKREHVMMNTGEPTLLCLALMKVLSTDNLDVASRCSRWLGPGWFARPVGFNAGRLREEDVPRIVRKLVRFGTVHEVHFGGGSLAGLRLFYLGDVPYEQLGPERGHCTFKLHTFSGIQAAP
jgi:hypothetical protein